MRRASSVIPSFDSPTSTRDTVTVIRYLLAAALFAFPAQALFLLSGARNSQIMPCADFDGENLIVAWTDLRDVPLNPSTNIYACRVSPAGVVLDSGGILVAGGARDEMLPRVCRGTRNSLVVWQEGC